MSLVLILYNLEDYKTAFEIYQKLMEIQPEFDDPETRGIIIDLESKFQ